MAIATPQQGNPRVGMLATVRNRRGIITAVEPYAGRDQELYHLVSVEYADGDGQPEDTLIWEREPDANLLEPTALPEVDVAPPLRPDEFDALVRATRWGALTPLLDPDGSHGPLDRLPFASPFHGAIQVDDFQLVPLVLALRMPRVTMLLADDVGLGKTIEAGLILAELIKRRRVRKMLIAVPASLQLQWQQEMRDKFSLSFDIVNRAETHQLRKRLGMDANPWRSFSRIITSYHYLKQPDVLDEFRAASRAADGSARLPWDVLIVDEAHNLMPSPFGDDSDLSKMLEEIAPSFEHKLFLTATPHNGHTRCFTGLLERLDPVRFSQTSELGQAERRRMDDVVVRRLKDDINAMTDPPRFCKRTAQAEPLKLSPAELALHAAFAAFRAKVRELISAAPKGEQRAGTFAVEVLGKRLLSSSVAFADSWHRCRHGMRELEEAAAAEVSAAERAVREDTDDDEEAESRTAHASTTVGAWLKPMADAVADEAAAIDAALADLGLVPEGENAAIPRPATDARFDAVLGVIGTYMTDDGNRWLPEERLVIFTEYKTTLDYLAERLRELHPRDGAILSLFGGVDIKERESIKAGFNDPSSPVRVLVATDTGSEGQNLQETARYLLHYDVPWNPSRMEQRNGRLDRHGQARDVTVFHFTSDDDADIRFLSYVLSKVHTIRNDLGSTGDVFDRAFQRRLIEGADVDTVQQQLERGIESAAGRAEVKTAASKETGEKQAAQLEALRSELDLDPTTLQQALDVAMGLNAGRPRLMGPDDSGHVHFCQPVPTAWLDVSEAHTHRREDSAALNLTFDPTHFIKNIGGRPVFRPEKDTALLHLAHPMFRRALAELARARFPGTAGAHLQSRWTVRKGGVPPQADALILLTVEEMAVNELRETIHHWVRTYRLPVIDGELAAQLPHVPARELGLPATGIDPDDTERARDVWIEVAVDVRSFVRDARAQLTERLKEAMAKDYADSAKEEQDRFASRQGELSHLIENTTIERLEREIAQLKREREQGVLFLFADRLDELDADIRRREEEIANRRQHYERLREYLAKERDRVLDRVLPQRYALRGEAQVLPVAVEIRLPGGVS